jgi:DNA-binding IclR family transcriptional regulator
MSDNTKYFLGTLNKALSLLDLYKEHEELGITEIGQLLSLGKSNVFRIVITLEHWGYLEKTGGLKYRLGTTIAYLGSLVLERQELIAIARPFLKELRNTCHETTHLAVLAPDLYATFLVKELARSSIQMASTVGMKMPAYATANGKVLLAFSDAALIIKYLDTFELTKKTANTITSGTSLQKVLQEIRHNGYAIDNEESEKGLTCYAAPVRNIQGKVIASISISGPTFRMAENKEFLIRHIIKTAREISRTLGENQDSGRNRPGDPPQIL